MRIGTREHPQHVRQHHRGNHNKVAQQQSSETTPTLSVTGKPTSTEQKEKDVLINNIASNMQEELNASSSSVSSLSNSNVSVETLEQEEINSWIDELNSNSITSTPETPKLSHPTLSRPKQSKRPPSHKHTANETKTDVDSKKSDESTPIVPPSTPKPVDETPVVPNGSPKPPTDKPKNSASAKPGAPTSGAPVTPPKVAVPSKSNTAKKVAAIAGGAVGLALIAGLITALTVAIIKNSDKIKAAGAKVGNAIKTKVTALFHKLVAAKNYIATSPKIAFNSMKGRGEKLTHEVRDVLKKVALLPTRAFKATKLKASALFHKVIKR